MKTITVDGNEACSKTSYLFTEMAGIYPITPSSTMAEHVDEWSKSKLNIFNDYVKVVEMQSEAGAAGFVHGALQSGVLATTFTASQGLLLMIPNMYKMAGEMLPAVIHVAARSLSTHSLSIFGDHQDIYATRQTGFCMLASSSVQDASYISGVAHLSAIKGSLPFLHFFDGFRTSHEINKINVLEDEDYKKLVDYKALEKFRKRALNPLNPTIKGTASNDDIYFQMTESRNKYYDRIPDIVEYYMNEINKLAHTDYMPFNYYGSKNAKNIIVAMGSVCETIKETIDELGGDIGLIEVHLYRPFSIKHLLNVLPDSVQNIAVLDRTKEAGSIGEPLYLDICASLKDKDINIVGGRYGLSSKNTTPKEIEAIYNMLNSTLKNNFTIGIIDDVTNLSLKSTDLKINKHHEMLIYGYGSDGMVSASKSIIKLLGDNTNLDVQGYFEYDSKKSGGVTIGHLRFSNSEIRSTYYVENPEIVVLTKDSYINNFDMLSNIKENGVFLISTDKSETELFNMFTKDMIETIKNKNITVYISRSSELARVHNLGNKISMIMEAQLLYLLNLIDYNEALSKIEDDIKKKFNKKGEIIVNSNISAIKDAVSYLKKVEVISSGENNIEVKNTNYDKINKRLGYTLKVSDFDNPDGTYLPATSKFDKRKIAEMVPNWIKDNCISCNQCATVCPHAVIRPYLISNDEYSNMPDNIKNRCIKPMNPQYKDYYFTIAISIDDCTGCGLCINTCPGKMKNKALEFKSYDSLKEEQEVFNYLDKNISEKDTDTSNVIGCAFKKPYFEFSGACAGCGETSYLRILTQLFGKHLVISNATGCSSIYGASMPSMPYSIPWASSLFEDNAEYGYGITMGDKLIKNRIKNIFENKNDELAQKWINNIDNYEVTKEVYDNLDYSKYPELSDIKDYLVKKSVWITGGDGWAFDIGFSGIDHVLSSDEDVNILVLNTQVYSNTGGQTSKATTEGIVAPFSSSGKKTKAKDLARIAMSYPNVYVAQINLGANMLQTIKALKEAEAHKGPSIVIAYAPCISHGIKGGMSNSLHVSNLATKSGYYPIFRYNPDLNKFTLDSKNVDFDLYSEFLSSQNRFNILKNSDPKEAEKLLNNNKEHAIETYNYFKELEN